MNKIEFDLGGGVKMALPADIVARNLLDSLRQQSSITQAIRPRIGEYLTTEGGIYVGDILGDDKVLYGLIVGEEIDIGMAKFGRDHNGDLSQWDGLSNTNALRGKSPAADLAANYERNGHCDFYLPARRELMVALANTPHMFNPKDYYWSSTTRGNDYAWAVYFELGSVSSYRYRVNEFRVRPLRKFTY
ncbi:MAG: hypothetical protein Q8L80_07990 [Gallionella sp.]|nr:hypothetical protein [Gallionella sp.]MDP1941249.1 hypothetical protein [Gallionella sp.]